MCKIYLRLLGLVPLKDRFFYGYNIHCRKNYRNMSVSKRILSISLKKNRRSLEILLGDFYYYDKPILTFYSSNNL